MRRLIAIGLVVLVATVGVTGWSRTHTSFENAYVFESCGRCYEGLVGEPPPESKGPSSPPTLQSMPGDGDGDESGGDADWAHAFGGVWWDPGQSKSCEGCNSCHTNSQPGRCGTFHCDCGGGPQRILADSIGTVAATGSVTELRALMSLHEDFVAYDATDGTIVLRDCEMAEVMRVVAPDRLKAAIKTA